MGHGEDRAKMEVYARYGRFVVVNHAIEEIRWCFVRVPLIYEALRAETLISLYESNLVCQIASSKN